MNKSAPKCWLKSSRDWLTGIYVGYFKTLTNNIANWNTEFPNRKEPLFEMAHQIFEADNSFRVFVIVGKVSSFIFSFFYFYISNVSSYTTEFPQDDRTRIFDLDIVSLQHMTVLFWNRSWWVYYMNMCHEYDKISQIGKLKFQ